MRGKSFHTPPCSPLTRVGGGGWCSLVSSQGGICGPHNPGALEGSLSTVHPAATADRHLWDHTAVTPPSSACTGHSPDLTHLTGRPNAQGARAERANVRHAGHDTVSHNLRTASES